MPEEKLKDSYVLARRVSCLGAICMYILAAFMLLILFVYLYAFTQTEVLFWIEPSSQVLISVSNLINTLSVFLLGEFFRGFAKGRSPFGPQQSRRLLVAGLLFALQEVLDLVIITPSFSVQVVDSVTLTTQPGPSLNTVVMIVFLICLALVVRYGNALKQDSDSMG